MEVDLTSDINKGSQFHLDSPGQSMWKEYNVPNVLSTQRIDSICLVLGSLRWRLGVSELGLLSHIDTHRFLNIDTML